MKTSYIIKHFAGSVFFFLFLFISAGRLDYWQGIIYATIGLIMVVLNYTVLKPDDELLTERNKAGEGSKKWDKVLLGLSLLMTIAMFIILRFSQISFAYTNVNARCIQTIHARMYS